MLGSGWAKQPRVGSNLGSGFDPTHPYNDPECPADAITEQKVSFFDLFKTSNLRKNTLIQYFNWFTTAFVYYGLTLNADTLIPGNMYLNFCVSGLIEFPAYIFCLVRNSF